MPRNACQQVAIGVTLYQCNNCLGVGEKKGLITRFPRSARALLPHFFHCPAIVSKVVTRDRKKTTRVSICLDSRRKGDWRSLQGETKRPKKCRTTGNILEILEKIISFSFLLDFACSFGATNHMLTLHDPQYKWLP